MRFEDIYEELREFARHMMRGERASHTLGATAIVHEAWCRLAEHERGGQPISHALVHRVMLHVLVDHARRHGAAKRGGGRGEAGVDLDGLARAAQGPSAEDVLAIGEALGRLGMDDPLAFSVLSMRIFRRMPMSEIAAELGLTDHEARARWTFAKAFVKSSLG